MSNIFDYVWYYRDATLTQVAWNVMDDLVAAILVYAPIPGFGGTRSLASVADQVAKVDLPHDVDPIVVEAKKLVAVVRDTRRYSNLRWSHLVNLISDKTQFGAVTLRLGNQTVIAFKGSDGTVISWLENYRLFYQYPTFTQELAAEYLTRNTGIFDRHVHVVGHSKGGNLAITSSMMARRGVKRRIEKIVNFDGPGVRESEYHSLAYWSIRSRLETYIPGASYVGTMLYADAPTIVQTSALAASVHYPTTWEIFGQFFVPGEWSKLSQQLHEATTTGLHQLDDARLEAFTEAAFAVMGKNYTENFNFKLADLVEFFRNARHVDLTAFRYLKTIAGVIAKLRLSGK